MREMDSLGLKICARQADLFEASKDGAKCSSPIFIRRFMNSDLAKRIDAGGIMFESTDVSNAFQELEDQYGVSVYGSEKYATEELRWIGYLYRYWCYVSEKTSKQLYKEVKPERLRKLYLPYHSLDPLQAIERITEESAPIVVRNVDDVARGVEIMRKIRNRRGKTSPI